MPTTLSAEAVLAAHRHVAEHARTGSPPPRPPRRRRRRSAVRRATAAHVARAAGRLDREAARRAIA